MAGLTWKMWLIGCYGIFCCILLLQSWPVEGLRLTVAGNLHHRGRYLLQAAPEPSTTSPPPPTSTSPPPSPAPETRSPPPPDSVPPPAIEPPPSPPPETPSPPPPDSVPPPAIEPPAAPPPEAPSPPPPDSVPPPATEPPPPPESVAPPPPEAPPASPPPELAPPPPASSPPETPPPSPVEPPPSDPSPPPPVDPVPPPSPTPTISATPDSPPPTITETPPPAVLDSPPPTVPDSPPPAVPDSPPPAVPESPPPAVPESPPPTVPDSPPPAVPDSPPPAVPDSPPPAVPDAPPPAVPDAPPPAVPDAPPPAVVDSPPPAVPEAPPPALPVEPPTSPPPQSPTSEPPVSSPPPPAITSPPPSEPPASEPPASSPAPALSPPSVLLPPPPSTAPPPTLNSPPPPPSPDAPPPSDPSPPPPNAPPPSDQSPPPPGAPPPTPDSPPPASAPPPGAPPPSTPDSPPPSSAPPPASASPPASAPPPPDSPPPTTSPTAPPPIVSTPPAAPPPLDASPPPLLAPPPLVVSPPPPPVATPPVLPPVVAPPPPDSILAPPPYALAPGPAVQGCCPANMMLRPGTLGTVQCWCVYPITVRIRFASASSVIPNLQDIFQTNLATSLGLLDVQVVVNYFKFGENSSFTVKAAATDDGPLNVESDIGSTSAISFSLAEITRINETIWSGNVDFNRTYFGNYSVISVIPEFIPAAAAPGPGAIAPPAQPVAPASSESSSNVALYAGIGGGVGVLVLCVLLALCIWRVRHRKKQNSNSAPASSKVSSLQSHQLATPTRWVPADSTSFPRPKQTREFTYEELSEATNGFAPSAFLGEGGFGKVYRGVLKDGTEVAIKKLTTGGHQGDREFLVEVEMLSRLHHRHLVKLLGYFCSREPLVQLLCYELIPNGSVESWLHGSLGETLGPLDWPTRMKIAIGSARGLHYLHEDSQPCVIHRDFKAANILLQNNFHAKVADFGLARLAPEGQGNYVSTRVMGTFGYVAPEYAMTGHLLVKSDVYSYGVVLLELLSGRKPIDYAREDAENITAWARPLLTDKSRVLELADPRLDNKFPPEDFAQVANLAKSCIEPEWRSRPTMGEVVATLNQICYLKEEYNTSSDKDGATTSSEHETGNLRSVGLGGIPLRLQMMSTSTSSSSSASTFSTPWPDRRRVPSAPYVSETGGPSMSTPSSGQFVGISGLVDGAPFSRTRVLSEDLQEGR